MRAEIKKIRKKKTISRAGSQDKNLGFSFLKKILIGLTKKLQEREHILSEKYKLGKTLAKYVFLSLAMGCIIAFLISALAAKN